MNMRAVVLHLYFYSRKQNVIKFDFGRSSDLLLFEKPSHTSVAGQWQKNIQTQKELTAAGTVPDSHRIPSY